MQVRDPEALRRWRQRRGLSQRDLAYLCRCTQATISLLERGAMTGLSDELALNLSARLQVPWEDLFAARPALADPPRPGLPRAAATPPQAPPTAAEPLPEGAHTQS